MHEEKEDTNKQVDAKRKKDKNKQIDTKLAYLYQDTYAKINFQCKVNRILDCN